MPQQLRNQPVSSVMTRSVHAVQPAMSLLALATEMHRKQISCVVVCESGKPVGIISERDVVRLLCQHRQPAALTAGEVMSRPVHTIRPDIPCMEVMQMMRERGIRRFPIIDAKGGLIGLVTQTDLLRASERELALHMAQLEQAIQEKTEEAERIFHLKDDLVGMIVHDLKNPLAVVLGILESSVQGRKPVEDPKLRKRLGLAFEAGRSMLRMVLNLLDLSKMESGQLQLNREPILFSELLEQSLKPMHELAEREGLKISVVRMPEGRALRVDAALMERVIQNLLSNAVKYSPSQGRIEVDCWIEGGTARFSVTNWGKPIPAEFHQKIFDKFAQLEAKHSAGIASTGLGLTFCKLVIEAHGGSIMVESPIDGPVGARFTCALPIA